MDCVNLARSWWTLNDQEVLLVHSRNPLERLLLTIIESVLVSLYEAHHILMAISIELIFGSFNLGEGPHRIQNDVMSSVKLAFLDR